MEYGKLRAGKKNEIGLLSIPKRSELITGLNTRLLMVHLHTDGSHISICGGSSGITLFLPIFSSLASLEAVSSYQ